MAHAAVAPATVQRSSSAGRRILQVLGLIALLLVGLLTLLLIGVMVGPVALAFGLVLATLPAPLYAYLALRIDRLEPEPARLLGWAFLWGATAATFIALILNSLGEAVVGSSFGKEVGELFGYSISAPIVEELAKAMALFAIYRWRRAEFDGPLDGMAYAAMVGLGFAMTENVLYYGRAALEGGVPLAVTFFMRGFMSPLAHPVFTAMTGLGLGIAAQATSGARRWVAPAAGLLAAMLVHSLWNTAASVGGGETFFGVYIMVMIPLFIGLIVVAVIASRREGRLIASHLQPEVAAGVLSAGDLQLLSRRKGRRYLRRAARRGGSATRRAARDWAATATDLAFLRHRVSRNLPISTANHAAEDAALVARLRELRPALGSGVQATSQWAGQPAAAETPAATVPAGRPATEWEPYVPGQPAAVAQPAAAAPAQPPSAPAAPAQTTPAPTPAAGGPPAAWHPDPWRQASWRWWDGAQWTHHTAN